MAAEYGERVVPFGRPMLPRSFRARRRTPRDRGARRVVAYVLDDGTVRPTGTLPPGPVQSAGTVEPRAESASSWASGRVFGDGWVLWWERRADLR